MRPATRSSQAPHPLVLRYRSMMPNGVTSGDYVELELVLRSDYITVYSYKESRLKPGL